jgi:ABC-type cobalt transport system, ATPase component
MENIIKVQNVTFSYDADSDTKSKYHDVVLNDVSLDIEKGSFVAVLGHNGSGKSTLAKHFNAILLPNGGKVFVENMNTVDDDLLFQIRQTVGMVFQNPDNQIVASIIEEDVAFGPENMGVPPAEIRQRVDDALKAVGIYDLRQRSPSQLSGGQKQRVAIAGIIAMRPKCIVLDEPTAMLDPQGRKEVLKTIHHLNNDYGITVVLITHFMNEAAQADRVVVMDNGSVILDGVPKNVFRNVDKLKEVGLDVPQGTELVHLLRSYNISADVDVLSVDETVDALMHIFGK